MELPLIESLRNRRVILASGSPRRRQLLASLDIPFEVDTDFTVDEHYPASIEALEVAPFLSLKKSEAYFDQKLITPETTVITSDTVVVAGSEVLGACSASCRVILTPWSPALRLPMPVSALFAKLRLK